MKSLITEKHRPRGVAQKGKRMFRNGETFYPINDYKKYNDAQGIGSQEMLKVGTAKARPSIDGRQHGGTVLNRGGENFSERDSFTEKPNHYIVKGKKGEQYQVPSEEFEKKYSLAKDNVRDEEGFDTYNVFSKRNVSEPIKHNVYKNMPEWGKGQRQFGMKGDAHVVDNSYLIGDPELRATHVDANGNKLGENRINMKRNVIRLTESQLHKVIKESVKRVLKEHEPASRIMDRLNGGTNRARFRDDDMNQAWDEVEPSYDEEEEMLSDRALYGNPNIDDKRRDIHRGGFNFSTFYCPEDK